jgi:hypothetical protein
LIRIASIHSLDQIEGLNATPKVSKERRLDSSLDTYTPQSLSVTEEIVQIAC